MGAQQTPARSAFYVRCPLNSVVGMQKTNVLLHARQIGRALPMMHSFATHRLVHSSTARKPAQPLFPRNRTLGSIAARPPIRSRSGSDKTAPNRAFRRPIDPQWTAPRQASATVASTGSRSGTSSTTAAPASPPASSSTSSAGRAATRGATSVGAVACASSTGIASQPSSVA